MVRSKNMLSVLMQVFVVFSLITVLWCIYGYSLAFTEGNAFFGGFDRLFLKGTFDSAKGEFAMAATFSKGTPIPELVFVAFQATFAAITVCLILGAFAERMKFSAVLLFAVLWFTFSYVPIAHMVWFWPGPDAYTAANVVDATNAKAGLIWQWGALDFAGGTVVHINAGIAGIVGAYVIGKRIGFGKEAMAPHNLPMTMIGASLLWVGLVRLQRRLRARGGQLGRARVHQHVPRHRVRRAVVDVRRVDVQGQAVDARRGVGRGRGPRRDHAGCRQRRHPGRVRDRHRWRASSACGASTA